MATGSCDPVSRRLPQEHIPTKLPVPCAEKQGPCGPFFFGSGPPSHPMFTRARLFIILFVRNFRRVCSQFWLSVRNSVWGPFHRVSKGNPSLCWLGGGGQGALK